MKITNNKKWMWQLTLIAFIAIFTVTSCKKDFLDRQPLGRFTEDDITAGSFDSKVFAAYSILRKDGFNHHLYLGIQSYRSDESLKGSTASDGAIHGSMYDDFEYDKTNGGISVYWSHHYELINAANDIIHTIDSTGANDPATLINRAEAKFLRAFSYFDLVRAFGQVPKIDFVGSPAELNVPKAPVGEIFALIDADLMEAASVLPRDWESKFIGRLTKGAALALQAKADLWRQNWAGALSAAKAVITLNRYSLVPDYAEQFRHTGENGPESIFEIQAYYTPTNDLGIIYANVQGVRGAGQWDLGWGWNAPSQVLVDEFEPNDPRLNATVLFSGQSNTPWGEVVPDYPGVVAQPYWNKKVYTNPADRLSLNNRFGRWMNHRILRYGDVLLMAAEAANELGGTQNTADALAWLEMIRARARGNNNAILPPVTTTDQAALRDAIRHERFVEMGMEEQRFWDIVRWGIDVQVLTGIGKNYQIKHRLLPIPQGEIDKSGGILIQNPDY